MNSDENSVLVTSHLRIALRNALILLPTVFFIGLLTGWALGRWDRTPIGAVLGALAALGFAAWAWHLYYRTRGLLHS